MLYLFIYFFFFLNYYIGSYFYFVQIVVKLILLRSLGLIYDLFFFIYLIYFIDVLSRRVR